MSEGGGEGEECVKELRIGLTETWPEKLSSGRFSIGSERELLLKKKKKADIPKCEC